MRLDILDYGTAETVIPEKRISAAEHQRRFSAEIGEIGWFDLPRYFVHFHCPSVGKRIEQLSIHVEDIQLDCHLPIEAMGCAGQAWVVGTD